MGQAAYHTPERDVKKMYSSLNAQLEKAQQEKARLNKIEAMLKEFQEELNVLKHKEKEFKEILIRENYDVEKLEQGSLVSFFYSLTGRLADKLEKEKTEALAANLKYEQTLEDIIDIESAIGKLTTERSNYLESRREYEKLYSQKKRMLLEENGAYAQEIMDLTERVNHLRINIREIAEALEVGQEALHHMDNALGYLSKAQGWGTFDLLGGGLIADLAKHSHLDSARGAVTEAQRALHHFQAELADIHITAEMKINIQGFITFADFFFDGIISDWFVQTRINESKASVEEARDQVAGILRRLRGMKDENERMLLAEENSLKTFIIEA